MTDGRGGDVCRPLDTTPSARPSRHPAAASTLITRGMRATAKIHFHRRATSGTTATVAVHTERMNSSDKSIATDHNTDKGLMVVSVVL